MVNRQSVSYRFFVDCLTINRVLLSFTRSSNATFRFPVILRLAAQHDSVRIRSAAVLDDGYKNTNNIRTGGNGKIPLGDGREEKKYLHNYNNCVICLVSGSRRVTDYLCFYFVTSPALYSPSTGHNASRLQNKSEDLLIN